jgi:hypothetical protein
MINRIGWMGAFGIFLLCSCSNDAGKSEVETQTSIEQPEETNELQNAFPKFFNYLSQQDSSFSVSKFDSSSGTPLDSTQAFPLNKKKLQPFSDYLIYNTDSSLAIDLYSYNYVPVQRNGTTVLEQGEPDTEVALIDTKTNTRRRIFFTGPGTSVQQAKWENDHTIFLAGVEETATDAVKPLLWKINLADKTMEIYNYRDTLQANVGNFVPEAQVKTTRAF